MNDWNTLESQLRRWKPRQPSPDLRSRIFGPDLAGPTVGLTLGDFSRWLVPALGCFLLVLASLSPHLENRKIFDYAATNWIAPAVGDEGHSFIYAPNGHSGVNAVPAKRLEWSFGNRPAAAYAGALLISYTNKLMQ